MKKYIIKDKTREYGDVKNREKMNKDGIKIHRFTFMRAYVSEDIIFSECRNMVEKIRRDDLRYQYSEADTEEIMYQTLLASIYDDELIWLDICFHLYYTLLYEKNKNSYTVLVEGRKEKECQRCRIKEGVETCDKCGKSKKCPKRRAASEYAVEFKKKRKEINRYKENWEKNIVKAKPFKLMGNRYEILKKNKRTVKIWDKCRIEKEYKSCAECAEHKTCKKYKEYLEYTQKRIEIACYRKCKMGRKRGEGIVWPFRIKEKRESEISQRTKRKYYKKTEVVNFAPEMVRLYYVSNGFKKLFKRTNKVVEDRYFYSKIIDIFQNNRGEIDIISPEEIWLSERLFGINLAWKFCYFFREILVDVEFCKIETEYIDIIRKIIREVKRWGGVYSRSLIIDKLKLICKLKVEGSREQFPIEPIKLLEYLYENVLCKNMEEFGWHYEEEAIWGYNFAKEGDIEIGLKQLKIECNKLKNQVFTYFDGYYYLGEIVTKEMVKLIGEEEQTEKEEKKKERFEAKLYALIQKIIILE